MKSQKGSTFERSICRTLSMWFSEGASDAIFWRSAQSGGMAKVRSKVGKKTFGSYGDIAALHPSGLALTQICLLELKRGYKQWSPFDVIDAKPHGAAKKAAKQTFELFVDQMEEDKRIGGIPYSALIYQRDKRHAGIGIETSLLMKMRSWCGAFDFAFIRYKVKTDYTFLTLGDFLEYSTPQFFIDMYKEIGQ